MSLPVCTPDVEAVTQPRREISEVTTRLEISRSRRCSRVAEEVGDIFNIFGTKGDSQKFSVNLSQSDYTPGGCDGHAVHPTFLPSGRMLKWELTAAVQPARVSSHIRRLTLFKFSTGAPLHKGFRPGNDRCTTNFCSSPCP
jgi:hypothetical protein